MKYLLMGAVMCAGIAGLAAYDWHRWEVADQANRNAAAVDAAQRRTPARMTDPPWMDSPERSFEVLPLYGLPAPVMSVPAGRNWALNPAVWPSITDAPSSAAWTSVSTGMTCTIGGTGMVYAPWSTTQ